MHGLLALEIYGNLRGLIRQPATLYELEILHLVHTLGGPGFYRRRPRFSLSVGVNHLP